LRPKRQRFLSLLKGRTGPDRIADELAHFGWLDPEYAHLLPHGQGFAGPVYELLRSKGAPAECYVVSTWQEYHNRTMPLAEAVEEIVGSMMPSIISCLPGKLAWFEDEYASNARLCGRHKAPP